MLFNTQDWIPEYLESHHFMFVEEAIKPFAEGVLNSFVVACEQKIKHFPLDADPYAIKQLVEERLILLDIPLQAKQNIPLLIVEFASWLESSGKFPEAARWENALRLAQQTFSQRLRADGSIKGQTISSPVQATKRNDPCPCGSGKKFKKCCG